MEVQPLGGRFNWPPRFGQNKINKMNKINKIQLLQAQAIASFACELNCSASAYCIPNFCMNISGLMAANIGRSWSSMGTVWAYSAIFAATSKDKAKLAAIWVMCDTPARFANGCSENGTKAEAPITSSLDLSSPFNQKLIFERNPSTHIWMTSPPVTPRPWVHYWV